MVDVAKMQLICRVNGLILVFATSAIIGLWTAIAQTAELPSNGWRLVRTTNPASGKDAVSIMHTADAMRSDPDFAGLMIRCGQTGNEVLIALITPFSLFAHPEVVLDSMGHRITLEAKVVPPASAVLLPSTATDLAEGPWLSLNEISVQVTGEGRTIHGIAPLKGLADGLQVLAASCAAN